MLHAYKKSHPISRGPSRLKKRHLAYKSPSFALMPFNVFLPLLSFLHSRFPGLSRANINKAHQPNNYTLISAQPICQHLWVHVCPLLTQTNKMKSRYVPLIYVLSGNVIRYQSPTCADTIRCPCNVPIRKPVEL